MSVSSGQIVSVIPALTSELRPKLSQCRPALLWQLLSVQFGQQC
jgi:hypothetical protein